MKQEFTLGLIGFDEKTLSQIKDIIKHSAHGLRVVCENKFEMGGSNLEFTPDEDVNVYLISIHALSPSHEKNLRRLMRKYNQSEFIVVSFEESYKLAIHSFRSGALDVVEFPFSVKTLDKSLERSKILTLVHQGPDSFNKLMTVLSEFGNFKKFKTPYDLSVRINQFLFQELGASPFLVYTYVNKDADKPKISGHRISWNEKSQREHYDKGKVDKFISSVKLQLFQDRYTAHFTKLIGDEYYYAVDLGRHDEIYFLGVFKIAAPKRSETFQTLIGHFCQLCQNAYQQTLLFKAREELTSLVHVDDVTNLYNQRKLHIDLEQAIKKYEETSEHFFVVFIDIDHFKNVNDGHGHLVGSQILVEVAQVLKATLRLSDSIYRYGGDEFVILVSTTTNESAQRIGERILENIKKKEFTAREDETFHLTVSVGIADFPKDAATKEEILNIADDMMYKAKALGRAKVVSTSELFENDKDKQEGE